MRVLAVTSWGGACGIANFAEQLRDHLPPDIEFTPSAEALNPAYISHAGVLPDVVWLNYHRGLHSQWTPEKVQQLGKSKWFKVVITFHDTYGESAPDALTQQLHDLADAFIVHEPCVGLPKQILIRQGVPAPAAIPLNITMDDGRPGQRWFRPMLGTCGFNFPWKNFDRLAEVTAACGWAYLVLSNNATDEDGARWKAVNPYTMWMRGFQSTDYMVAALSACDATCFAYECAYDEILWCDFKTLPYNLRRTVHIARVDPGIAHLAHQDSWVNQGRRYAEIFRDRA